MKEKSADMPLMLAVFALLILGIVMISSVSVYPSFTVTSKYLEHANNYFYISRSAAHAVVAIGAFIGVSLLPYTLFEKYSKYIYGGSILLLGYVLIAGEVYNGAKGWINIPGISFSLQPVEFAKISIIIFLAAFLKKRRFEIGTFYYGFLPFFGYFLVMVGLIAMQPDFGSILILTPLVILIYFVGGGNPKYILVSLAIAAIGAASVYGVGKMGDGKGGISYISSRIDTFLRSNEELFIKGNARDKDYQTRQGLITIGSGGFGGLGFGKSIQKFGYLPEVQGDFIFSVFVEELGFVGALVLISLYLYIVHRCYRIAFASTDPFARIVAFGVATLIFVQASINIGVNLNIVPLTGVTLPFMSYGGSSLLTLMIGVGIVVSISRTVDPDRLANTNAMSRRIVQG